MLLLFCYCCNGMCQLCGVEIVTPAGSPRPPRAAEATPPAEAPVEVAAPRVAEATLLAEAPAAVAAPRVVLPRGRLKMKNLVSPERAKERQQKAAAGGQRQGGKER